MKDFINSIIVFGVMGMGMCSVTLWALFALMAIGYDTVVFEYGFYAGICQIVWMIGLHVVQILEID